MPKSKEYLSDSDDTSDEDVKPTKKEREKKRERPDVEEKAAPTKKAKKEDAESIWDLGNNRQVNVREFKGKLYVDIREMYYDKDGDLKPGKKGIALNVSQWRKLMSVMEEVDNAVKSKC